MATINQGTITVNNTTATNILLYPLKSIVIQNIDPSATVYIGNTAVTSSSYGFRLGPSNFINLNGFNAAEQIYVISSVASSQISVMYLTI
jgi:hypothetical protein